MHYLQLHEIWIYAIIGIVATIVFAGDSIPWERLTSRVLQLTNAWKVTWIVFIVVALFTAEWAAIKYHRVVLRIIPELLLCAVVIYAPQLFAKKANGEAEEPLQEDENPSLTETGTHEMTTSGPDCEV